MEKKYIFLNVKMQLLIQYRGDDIDVNKYLVRKVYVM